MEEQAVTVDISMGNEAGGFKALEIEWHPKSRDDGEKTPLVIKALRPKTRFKDSPFWEQLSEGMMLLKIGGKDCDSLGDYTGIIAALNRAMKPKMKTSLLFAKLVPKDDEIADDGPAEEPPAVLGRFRAIEDYQGALPCVLEIPSKYSK